MDEINNEKLDKIEDKLNDTIEKSSDNDIQEKPNEKIVEEEKSLKKRKRKKQKYKNILNQMEFYFSDANLSKDRFLTKLIQQDPQVDLNVFLNFNKIKTLTNDIQDIKNALKNSTFLKLNGDKVYREGEVIIKQRENVDDCTIYVERIPSDMTHDRLKQIFSKLGNVLYVSIPKFKHNKMIKGFAFVEFDCEEAVKKTCNYFSQIGGKLNTNQFQPDQLYSIVTYEKEEDMLKTNENPPSASVPIGDLKEDKMNEEENSSRKRKLSEENETICSSNKKLAIDPNDEHLVSKQEEDCSEQDDEKELNEDVMEKQTKKKRRRNKKAKNTCSEINELRLRILTKREWKQLRNKYLNMQRDKMKAYKAQLYKKTKTLNKNDESKKIIEKEEKIDENKKNLIMAGTIVRVTLNEPCVEVKQLKNEVKTSFLDSIKYVECKEGDQAIYLRFTTSNDADLFANGRIECVSLNKLTKSIDLLSGDEEREYFNKIDADRAQKKATRQKPKQRGKDKLMKKFEKQLGKHIRFDDSNEKD